MSTGENPGGSDDWRPPDERGYQPPTSGQNPPPPPGSWGPPPGQQPQWGSQPYGGQPYGGGGQYGGGPPVENYLVWSILTTLFCCLPFGIASIVFSTQVNTKQAQGDYRGAVESSRKAKNWAIASAVSAVILVVLLFGFGLLGALVPMSNSVNGGF